MKLMQFLLLMLGTLTAITTGGMAHEYSSRHLIIEHPHITAPLPGVKVSAGYVVIRNSGEKPERLTGVKAEFAEKVQLHNVKIVDGVAKMRPVKGGLEIAPGGKIQLKKGGYHLMFMKVSDKVEIGQLVPAKFMFEEAGIIEVEMIVMDPADLDDEEDDEEMPEMDHSDHTN